MHMFLTCRYIITAHIVILLHCIATLSFYSYIAPVRSRYSTPTGGNDLADKTFAGTSSEAFRCYEQALEVYTPEAFPDDYAGTMHNISVAFATGAIRLDDQTRHTIVKAIRCSTNCSEALLKQLEEAAPGFRPSWL